MTPETAVAVLGGMGRPVAAGESVEPDHEERLLSHREVCRMTSLHRNTIYKLEVRGLFPERIMITANKVGWHAREVHAWMASRPTLSEARERATVVKRREVAVPRQEGLAAPSVAASRVPVSPAERKAERPVGAGRRPAPEVKKIAKPARQSRRGARRSRR